MRPKPPILPRNKKDPTGIDRLERGAMREFKRRIRTILKGYIDILGRVPVEPAVNRKYEFRLDPELLSLLLSEGDGLISRTLLEGGERGLWFYELYVSVAYTRGTAQEFANLSNQSVSYKGAKGDLASLLRSQPYRRRLALLRAREFEEMKGLAGTVKANMARVLTDGLGRGLNPRDIAKNLTAQAGIDERRANRIARTEISTALRRARWDESEDAQERYGLQGKEMHLSALSPTTRVSHAQRHGNLYTTEEVRDWYAEGANSINCKCNQVFVLTDDSGKPLVPGIQERARETYRKMAAREGYEWTEE